MDNFSKPAERYVSSPWTIPLLRSILLIFRLLLKEACHYTYIYWTKVWSSFCNSIFLLQCPSHDIFPIKKHFPQGKASCSRAAQIDGIPTDFCHSNVFFVFVCVCVCLCVFSVTDYFSLSLCVLWKDWSSEGCAKYNTHMELCWSGLYYFICDPLQ